MKNLILLLLLIPCLAYGQKRIAVDTIRARNDSIYLKGNISVNNQDLDDHILDVAGGGGVGNTTDGYIPYDSSGTFTNSPISITGIDKVNVADSLFVGSSVDIGNSNVLLKESTGNENSIIKVDLTDNERALSIYEQALADTAYSLTWQGIKLGNAVGLFEFIKTNNTNTVVGINNNGLFIDGEANIQSDLIVRNGIDSVYRVNQYSLKAFKDMYANAEFYIRDTSIIDLIQEHSVGDVNIQTYSPGNDTILFASFSNPYDTLNISRDLTIFIDTTGAYQNESTASFDLLGVGSYNTVTFSSNADIFNIKYNVDSLWRSNGKGNSCIAVYEKKSIYRRVELVCDTFSYTMPDIVAPVAQTHTVENSNPDSLIIDFNENVTGTEGAGTGGWTITGLGSLTITNVNVNADKVGLKLSGALTAEEVYTCDYNSSTGDLEDLNGNPLASYTDSSVTNNVISESYQSLTIQTNHGIVQSTDDYYGDVYGSWGDYCLFNEYLNTGDDGYLIFDYSSTDDGSVIIAFDAVNSNKDYYSYDYGIFLAQSTGTLYRVVNGSPTSITTISTGSKLKLSRVSGNLLIEYDADGDGSGWVTEYDFGSHTGTYYINLNTGNTANYIRNLKGYNVQ